MIDHEPNIPQASNKDWLDVLEFAELAGIHHTNARTALSNANTGKTWHGFALEVRKINGKAYQVNPHTLPPELRLAWIARQPNAPLPETAALVAIPAAVEKNLRLHTHNEIELGKWKEKLILPVLEFPKRSRARGGAIKDISEREHVRPDGMKCRYSARALGLWVELYEEGGISALMRKPRQEKGPRVFINRAWDTVCPLDEARKTAISEAIKTHIKSLWATANPGWVKVENLASSKLVELCQSHGWQTATYETCRLGRHIVEASRQYGDIHTKEKHAKKFFDLIKPRITRDHSMLQPMQIIVGDVHPVDVPYLRQDGSTATPRMIAWYDVSNHRIFYNLVALAPGQGITQADVWASFAAMVEAWGLPERLYLDNGSEYNGNRKINRETLDGLIRGFNELSTLVIASRQFMDALTQDLTPEFIVEAVPLSVRDAQSLYRSIPFNAPGKPGLEGGFASVEKVLSMLPGYIGGDRMKQRIPKLGKKNKPWQSFEELEAAIKGALDFWHTQPQAGNLKNKSPNAVYASQIAAGWRAVSIPRAALIYALSEAKTYKVQNDGIVIGSLKYYGDALARYAQQRVHIRYAKWAPERVILVENSAPLQLAWLDRDTEYHPLDEAGAIEQSRRESLIKRVYKDMKAETAAIDMQDEMARTVSHQPPAQATLFGPAISLGSGVQTLIEAGQKLGAPKPHKPRVLRPGEVIDETTGKVIDLLDRLPMSKPSEPQLEAEDLLDRLVYHAPEASQPDATPDPFDNLTRRYAAKE